MSNFNLTSVQVTGQVYDLAKYSIMVLSYLEDPKSQIVNEYGKGSGKILADNGVVYEISLKDKSFTKFKELVLLNHNFKGNATWEDLKTFLKDKKNEFKVLSTKPASFAGERGKYETLSWLQIQKIPFSSPSVKLTTEQQEKITLLIFEAVLGKTTPDYQSFAKMFEPNDKNPTGKPYSKVKQQFPKLRTENTATIKSWWNHFDLQFREVANGKGQMSEFPNAKYDVYLYGGANSFMDYVSKLVTQDIGFVSQKDTWNPADVWLLKDGAQKNFAAGVAGIKKKIDSEIYANDKLGPIREINKLLAAAYHAKEIVGISLKKSDGVKLKYELFNLSATETDLPETRLDKIKLDCSYDSENYRFKSKTANVFVNDTGERVFGGKKFSEVSKDFSLRPSSAFSEASYKMSYKSNTGEGKLGNITYEFLPSSKATAFLGKVPKESLEKWLKDQVGTEMPRYTDYPTDIGPISKRKAKDFLDKWTEKVKVINSAFPTGNDILKLNDFVDNLANSYAMTGLSTSNSTMMQLVDFTYSLALLKNKEELDDFLTRAYYFAQKKGVKYNFGPFGKLY